MRFELFGIFVLIVMLISGVPLNGEASDTKDNSPIDRISAEDTRVKTQAGEALLICSYDDSDCESKLLEGALLRSEFESKLASLVKDQELIFYCG
jgi:hypothetical protein